MNYKYSICYPDQKDIVYFDQPISAKEVMDIAKNHPWKEQLEITEKTNQDSIYYSPSLDFVNLQNGRSLGLTAVLGENNEIEFSLWYNRLKKVKVLFGLLGEKENMSVDDVWGFNIEQAFFYLEQFVNGNYQMIEELYKKYSNF